MDAASPLWQPIDPVNWQPAGGTVATFDWSGIAILGIAAGAIALVWLPGAAARNRRRLASAAEAGAVAALVPAIRAGRRVRRIVQAASSRAGEPPE